MFICTIGDLANYPRQDLYKYFRNQAYHMIDIANGIDNSEVKKEREAACSISNSTTLAHDIINKIEIYQILEQISDNVARMLRKQNKYAYVIAVQLKDCYFKSSTHQKKLKNATNFTEEIFKISKELVDEMWDDSKIRLVGLKAENLVNDSKYQVSLFEPIENNTKNEKLEKTMDTLKNKYGSEIINKASLNNKIINKKY